MLPQADTKVMEKVISDENELNARIYRFPTSAIKLNGTKINYCDFLCNTTNRDCHNALKRILDRIDVDKIAGFINEIEYLPDLQKEFYNLYIRSRYDKILVTAYNFRNN